MERDQEFLRRTEQPPQQPLRVIVYIGCNLETLPSKSTRHMMLNLKRPPPKNGLAPLISDPPPC